MVTSAQILHSLQLLHQKVDILMSQSDDLAADVTTIEDGVAALSTAATNLSAAEQAILDKIAALQAANPALDLTALNQAAADLTGAVSSVSGVVTSVQAIAPPAG